VTNTLALLRLLPISSRDKDAEILALRHHSHATSTTAPPAGVENHFFG
jgi:hypothetical protein